MRMTQSYLEIPHRQWPGEKVYFYCPPCDEVFGLPKGGGNNCPSCRQPGLKDVFQEISQRIVRSWGFFERTRYEANKWLFRYKPGDKVSFFATGLAMALYGELRAMGFVCPWQGTDNEIISQWIDARLEFLDPETGLIDCSKIGGYLWYSTGPGHTISQYVSSGLEWTLENRLFEPDRYRMPSSQSRTKDFLESIESFHELVNLLPNSYGGGSWITGALLTHREVLRMDGTDESDDMIDYVHHWLDAGQDPETGRWLACADKEYNPEIIANGMFKIIVGYESFNWKINYPQQIIDFLIDVRADPKRGFDGEATCSIFDPMMVAWVLRKRGYDYRKEEINEVVAKSFLAFKDRWDDESGWFAGGTWQEKHNFGTPLYMATILLDLPIMDICGIYNWRLNPVITTNDDGTVTVNEVTYTG